MNFQVHMCVLLQNTWRKGPISRCVFHGRQWNNKGGGCLLHSKFTCFWSLEWLDGYKFHDVWLLTQEVIYAEYVCSITVQIAVRWSGMPKFILFSTWWIYTGKMVCRLLHGCNWNNLLVEISGWNLFWGKESWIQNHCSSEYLLVRASLSLNCFRTHWLDSEFSTRKHLVSFVC